MRKLILALLLSAMPAMAQTQVTMRFTFDDGTPVAGKVTINNAPGQNGGSLSVTLDASGYLSQSLALSSTATYTGQLEVDNSNASGPQFTSLTQLPTGSAASAAAIAFLNTGEIDLTVSKATGQIVNSAFNVFQPFPQVKLASCVSTPPFGATPNSPGNKDTTSDTGGGAIVDYIVAGETFDCQVTVPHAGTYMLGVRAETPNSVPLHFEYPIGTTVGTVSVAPTISAWGAGEGWQTFSGGMVSLPGPAIIRLKVDSTTKWSLNLNTIN